MKSWKKAVEKLQESGFTVNIKRLVKFLELKVSKNRVLAATKTLASKRFRF